MRLSSRVVLCSAPYPDRRPPRAHRREKSCARGILDHRGKGDLKRFKEFVEERGSETGAWRGDVDCPGN